MAFEEKDYDIRDLPDLELDDLDLGNTGLSYFDDFSAGELGVPQDPIEDFDWFPGFSDDFISVGGLFFPPENQTGTETFPLKDFSISISSPSPFEEENSSSSITTTTTTTSSTTAEPTTPEQKSEDSFNSGKRHKNVLGFGFSSVTKKKRSTPRPSGQSWATKVRFLLPPPPLTPSPSLTVVEELVTGNGRRRRCTHCQVDKTPQWRMGPLGPNTLCNACGVRYKSGRLMPEYRPAASPTFDSSKHSNFHKKILKRKGAC